MNADELNELEYVLKSDPKFKISPKKVLELISTIQELQTKVKELAEPNPMATRRYCVTHNISRKVEQVECPACVLQAENGRLKGALKKIKVLEWRCISRGRISTEVYDIATEALKEKADEEANNILEPVIELEVYIKGADCPNSKCGGGGVLLGNRGDRSTGYKMLHTDSCLRCRQRVHYKSLGAYSNREDIDAK